ncbi:hypothetical protein CAMRE0001_1651 [Campylobacter rectus RM3267]|uniref:Uncharacterized protein n=1 Tax=Campylobacter rectus RM3267 TaxID=553218 RepID=B9CZ72_CAMRE|nr:hypothetical protein CAMRE0001_1651 [Campylobacter rectus RM3267]
MQTILKASAAHQATYPKRPSGASLNLIAPCAQGCGFL